jgi:hypothetical protein
LGDQQSPFQAGCWLFDGQQQARRSDMRVATAFKRMLGLPGLGVQDVQLSPGEVLVVAPRRSRAKRCPGCGVRRGVTVKDWRTKRGRHLDIAAGRVCDRDRAAQTVLPGVWPHRP